MGLHAVVDGQRAVVPTLVLTPAKLHIADPARTDKTLCGLPTASVSLALLVQIDCDEKTGRLSLWVYQQPDRPGRRCGACCSAALTSLLAERLRPMNPH